MFDGSETNIFNYVYDKIGQLTEVKKNNSTIETYSYDSNGNRLNNNSQYDSQDRLISNSSTTFGYTERGTLLTRTENNQTTNYNYDLMGNLLSVTLPNSTEIEYITDPRNRRIAKKVNGTVVQKFLYLNQLEPIAELDANDNIISLFMYGTRSNTPDYIIKNNVKYKVVTNQLGSVVKVVNVLSGEIVQAIEYDSFGNILNDSNPNFQPFRLAGGLYDVDTKLTRFGARDYDSREGRWTAKDPIKFDGGRNFYVYAGNNPIILIDVNGKNPTKGANRVGLNPVDLEARNSIQQIVCLSIKHCSEYSGWKLKDGSLLGNWGNNNHADLPDKPIDGTVIIHAHGCATYKGEGESFSEGTYEFPGNNDKFGAHEYDSVIYLGTPTGRVLKYDPNGNGEVVELPKIDLCNCSATAGSTGALSL